MNKRIISTALVLLICLMVFSLPAAATASATISATYENGVVTVTGTGFTGSTGYTVRVVNTSASGVTAMKQVTANSSGAISVSITTGLLSTLSNYTVYVNSMNGTLAASDASITSTESSSDDSGSSGGGGGGGGTGGSSATTTTSGNTTTTSAVVTGSTNYTTGQTTATVTENMAKELLNNAKSAESGQKNALVEIKLETNSASRSAEVTIPGNIFGQIANDTNADVKINTGIGSITFDAKAVESISGSAGADISIGIEKVDTSSLSGELQSKIGDHPVYDFSVTSAGNQISSFGGGQASISVPYTPQPGEDQNAIVVYYIDDTGNLQTVRGAYNTETGMVDFVVSHFSQYTVGYNKVTFTDVVSTAWYSNAVTFIAARGITSGTTATTFSPDTTLTRGQFIVMLMRAYNIQPQANLASNFSDAGNSYYTDYLATAKNLGIATGIGNNQFAPDRQISRQDMFTLLYRALSTLDELPTATVNNNLSDYSDAAVVSVYATDAFSSLIKGGIVSGSDGKLDPTGQSTRAQMAQILYNLLS